MRERGGTTTTVGGGESDGEGERGNALETVKVAACKDYCGSTALIWRVGYEVVGANTKLVGQVMTP